MAWIFLSVTMPWQGLYLSYTVSRYCWNVEDRWPVLIDLWVNQWHSFATFVWLLGTQTLSFGHLWLSCVDQELNQWDTCNYNNPYPRLILNIMPLVNHLNLTSFPGSAWNIFWATLSLILEWSYTNCTSLSWKKVEFPIWRTFPLSMANSIVFHTFQWSSQLSSRPCMTQLSKNQFLTFPNFLQTIGNVSSAFALFLLTEFNIERETPFAQA